MINEKAAVQQRYSTPVCEVVESVPEGVLCESAKNGTTEDFDNLGDYNW